MSERYEATSEATRYDVWKAKANAACVAKCGMHLDDLPDVDYYCWFVEGMSPSSAATRAIRSAKEGYGF